MMERRDKNPDGLNATSPSGCIHLIPSVLSDDGYESIPAVVTEAVKTCSVFFVESERSARRYLKRLWPGIVIDSLEWHVIDPDDPGLQRRLLQCLEKGQDVGVLSDAGCPGVADPGQALVAFAHEAGARVRPLAGPSSILMALMASGMNGQRFRFNGYLPTDKTQRAKSLRELESESMRTGGTEIFMETPYRNDAMLQAVMESLRGTTRLCIAADIGSSTEWIRTRSVTQWKSEKASLHKRPAIFLLSAS